MDDNEKIKIARFAYDLGLATGAIVKLAQCTWISEDTRSQLEFAREHLLKAADYLMAPRKPMDTAFEYTSGDAKPRDVLKRE